MCWSLQEIKNNVMFLVLLWFLRPLGERLFLGWEALFEPVQGHLGRPSLGVVGDLWNWTNSNKRKQYKYFDSLLSSKKESSYLTYLRK